MQIADLMRYNHVVRGLYLDAMTKLPWVAVVEPKGLSFDSMRNVFLHLTFVEDRWINFIIPGRFGEWVDLSFDDFGDIDSLKKYVRQTEIKTEKYLEKLSNEELNKQVVVPWGNKPETRISIETALCQIVMEDMIHYGELSALLWQMNIEAPYLGFWRYKHMHP
jgi:uncharacterized damage-inducible protein DinB